MEDILGRGKIIVEIEQKVARELAKIESEVEATKKAISRDKATIELDAKIAPLEKKVEQAKAKVEEWRAEASKNAELGLDTKNADRKLKEWEAKLKERRSVRDEVKLDTSQAQRQLRQLQRLEEREAAADRKLTNQRLKGQEQIATAHRKVSQQIEQDNAKVAASAQKTADKEAAAAKKAADKKYAESQRAEAARIKSAQREEAAVTKAAKKQADAQAREAKRAADAQTREDKKAADAHVRETQRGTEAVRAENQRAIDTYNRDWDSAIKEDWKRASAKKQILAREAAAEAASVERDRANQEQITQNYIRAVKSRARAQQTLGRTFLSKEERFTATLEEGKALRQMAELEAKLRAIGKDPVEIRTKVTTVHDRDPGAGVAKLVSGLTDTTIRMGPFTTTIAGAVRALALLGPAITGVVGALGALVGALGAGLVGAAGAATAGLGAFGLILGSTFIIGKRLMGGMTNLMAANKAYNKAVADYGKNSKQAKDKLEQLNKATAGAGPVTREAFKGYQNLGKTLDKVANRSKPAFMADLNQGFKTGNALLKDFAPQMTKSFSLVSRGWQTMMKGLRSSEGQRIIGDLFNNGLKALPKFGAGLGNLAHAAGNVAAAFSKMLPSLGGGFEKWTQGILKVTQNSGKMNSIVHTTIGAMRSVGHFAQAAGRMLIEFFGQGVGPGVSLIDRMTGGLNKMTSAMQRTGSAGSFFKDAVGTTEKLFQALKPVAQLFMEWSTIMRPFTDAMLSVLAVIGRVVSALSRFGVTRGILQAAFGIFIAGTLVSKIGDVIGAVKTLYGAMKALGAIKIGGNILNAITGGGAGVLGGGINKLAGRQIFGTVAKDAAEATGQLALFEAGGAAAAGTGAKVASSAERAAGGLEKTAASGVKAGAAVEGVVGTEAMFGPWGLAAAGATAAVAGGLLLLIHRSHDYEDAIKGAGEAQKVYNGTLRDLPGTEIAAAQSSLQVSQAHRDEAAAQKQVDALRRKGKTGTLQYKYALDQLHEAQINSYSASQQQKQAFQQITATSKKAVTAAGENFKKTSDALKALRGAGAPFTGRGAISGNNYGQLFDSVAKAAKAAHKPVTDFIDALNLPSGVKDKLQQIATAQDNVAASARQTSRAEAQLELSVINSTRAAHGLVPVAQAAAQAYQSLSSKIGQKKTSKLSLQFDSAGAAAKAGQVANSIASKTKGGAKFVMKVIADSKSAEETMRKLNAYKLATKRMPLTAEGKDKLINDLAQVAHYKLPVKPQRMTQEGKEALIRDLQQIIAMKFKTKTQPVNESGSNTVMGILHNIASFGLPGKVVPIVGQDSAFWSVVNAIPSILKTVFVNIVSRKSGFSGGMFSEGGVVEAAADGTSPSETAHSKWIARAYTKAEQKEPRRTTGGKYDAPTLLVGEESRREYVIATNPAYRRSNRQYLAAAAADFGYSLVPSRMLRGQIPFASVPSSVDTRGGHVSGIVSAAKGHPGPLAKSRTKGHGKKKHQVPLKVPKRYTAGSVDPQNAKNDYTKAEGNYKTRQRNYDDAESRVRRYRHGPRGESTSARHTREHNLKLARQDAARARNGKKGQYSLAQLRNVAANLKARWVATQKIQDKIDSYSDTAESDRSIMDRNSTIYNQTGDPAALTRYNNAKKDRDAQLKAIAGLLTTARANAKPKGSKRWRALDKNLNSTLNDITQNKYETAEGPAPLGIEDIINKLGLTKEYLGDLNAVAAARALTPTVDDNPATAVNEHAASLADDLKATKNLYSFYAGLYNKVKGSTMVSVQTKTDILDAMTSAYSDFSGVQQDIAGTSGGSAPAVDTAQVRDTARYQTMEQYGSNPQAINLKGAPSAGYSPSSPTGISDPSYAYSGAGGGAVIGPQPTTGIAGRSFSASAGSSAAAPTSTTSGPSNVTINNTFATVPPEPHAWSAGVAFEIGGML